MTILKLNKKPSETSNKARGPVRRADPAKRDRSKAPTTKLKPEGANESTRQRNHRHDGRLREDPNASQASSKEQPILRSEFKDRSFVKEKSEQGIESKHEESGRPSPHNETNESGRVQAETTRNYADREGSYRNPPRRGGKARDGFVASEFDNTRAAKTAKHNKAAANLASKQDSAMPRLSKRMADLGLCSRREADEWISNGWVKVDGEIVDVLGTRISPDAEIIISGYAMEHQSESVTILLHKPIGHVSGQAEDGYQPAIVLVHPDNEWLEDPQLNEQNTKEFQRGFLKGLAPAGRLDIDSTGLLVLTQDGRIARHLIGQDTSVEKEYLVRVEGELSDKDLDRLNHGLSLDGEQLKPAKVSWQNEDQLRFVLREGKKRQIRRMCEMVGLHVVGLKRVRIGSINLGKLPLGQWRYLHGNEQF
ncbi:MAG: pseudouridine synthase [Methylophilaceae bacterium]